MENSFGSDTSFTEKIPSEYKPKIKSQDLDGTPNFMKANLTNPFIIPGIKNLKIDSQLNLNYNFESFLEGDSNRLARSAGYAVSKRPVVLRLILLPIFEAWVWVNPLANAIGINVKQAFPEKAVLYISAESLPSNMLIQ